LAAREGFLTFVRDGKVSADINTLKAASAEIGLPEDDRSRSAWLVYIVNGDIKYAVDGLTAAPSSVSIFCEVRDKQFGEISARVISDAMADDVESACNDKGHAGSILRVQPIEGQFYQWIEAMYYQDAPRAATELLWNHAEHFRFREITSQKSSPVSMFGVLRATSVIASLDLIEELLHEERYHEIEQIVEKFPQNAIEIRDTISRYRYNIKTAADRQLAASQSLMSSTAAASERNPMGAPASTKP